MRIAQVAPLYESVPPKYYGGTERIVSYLTRRWSPRGTRSRCLPAETPSRRPPGFPVQAVAEAGSCAAWTRWPPRAHAGAGVSDAGRVRRGSLPHRLHALPLSRRHAFNHLTTLHGRLDLPDLVRLHREFADMPWSRSRPPSANRCAGPTGRARCITACPRNLYRFQPEPGGYLAFLGRISPENEWTGPSKSPAGWASHSRSRPRWTGPTRTTSSR